MTDIPKPSSSSWSCTRHALVYPRLCCTGEPCTGPSTPDVPHQCCGEGKDDLPQLAGNALPSAAQDDVALLCSKGTLLAHLQVVHQNPQVLFCKAAFQLISSQPVLVQGVVPPQGLDLAFAFVDLHDVPISPFLQPTQVPLNGSTTAWCIGHSSQFCVICQLAECGLWPIVQVINGDAKPYWPQNQLLGHTNSSWLPVELHATDHTPLSPAGQPVSFQFTALVFSAQRAIRLFSCDFPFTNPH